MTPHVDLLRRFAVVAVLAAAVASSSRSGEAHKPITSRYTYNDDVFPILRERCARCHVPGGVAPMSLMTYEDAFPWGESIRAELVAAHMPPAAADGGFGEVTQALALSPKELDVLLTRASGGNPRGALDQKLPAVDLKNDWVLGKPDLEVPLPAQVSLGAETMEETRDFTVPTGSAQPRWVRAVDLRPGNPAIVRSATVALKGAPDRVLLRWLPDQDPHLLDGGAAFRLPAGAELAVKVRYKKTWSYEGKVMTDRSTIGIYFADGADAHELTPLTVVSASELPTDNSGPFSFTGSVDRDVQVFAINPDQLPDDVALQIEAVKPDGARVPLVRFVARTEWTRRYWLANPVPLPRGTRIEISGVGEDAELAAAAFGGPPSGKAGAPPALKVALDVVASSPKPAAP